MNRALRAADRWPAWALLGPPSVLAVAALLWFGRDTTFSLDEIAWFMESPGLGLNGALQPHDGHLIFTTHVVFKLVLEAFGSDYLPFRILTVGSVLLTVALLFTYASRRVGKAAALAPCIVLLFFGSDRLHVLEGNGFTVLVALSCGIGALIALDREDRRGALTACGLLCLGVVTYTVALAFVGGIGLSMAIRRERWKRLWVVATPAAIYAAWWLWARGSSTGPDQEVALANAFLAPVWAFQSLGASLSALVGLNYGFPGSSITGGDAATPLALVALFWFGRRILRGSIRPAFYAALGSALVLWLIEVLAASSARIPDSGRYLYPGAIVVLLVAVEASRGVRLTPQRLALLYAVAAVGLFTNGFLLRQNGAELRTYSAQVRAGFVGLDLAGPNTVDEYYPPGLPDGQPSPLGFPFGSLEALRKSPSRSYLAAAEAYGPIGYSPEELLSKTDETRSEADAALVRALGLQLKPATAFDPAGCRSIASTGGAPASFELPSGGAQLEAQGAGGPVEVRRFGPTAIEIGRLERGQPAQLRIPTDRSDVPWRVSAPAPALFCPLP